MTFDQIADSMAVEIDDILRTVEQETNHGLELEVGGATNPRRIALRCMPVGIAPGRRTMEIRHDAERFGRPYLVEVMLSSEAGLYLRVSANRAMEAFHLSAPALSGAAKAAIRAMLRRQVWAGRTHEQKRLVEMYGEDFVE